MPFKGLLRPGSLAETCPGVIVRVIIIADDLAPPPCLPHRSLTTHPYSFLVDQNSCTNLEVQKSVPSLTEKSQGNTAAKRNALWGCDIKLDKFEAASIKRVPPGRKHLLLCSNTIHFPSHNFIPLKVFGYGAKMHQCVNIFLGNFGKENQQPAYKIAGKGAIKYYFQSMKHFALLTNGWQNPTESTDFHFELPPIRYFLKQKIWLALCILKSKP